MVLARFRKPALAVTIGAAALALPLSLAVPAEAAAAGDSGGAPASARPGAASVINNPFFAGYPASGAGREVQRRVRRRRQPVLRQDSARRARLRDPHLYELPCRREGPGSLTSCPVPAREQQRHPPDRHRGAVAGGHRVRHALQAFLDAGPPPGPSAGSRAVGAAHCSLTVTVQASHQAPPTVAVTDTTHPMHVRSGSRREYGGAPRRAARPPALSARGDRGT